MAYRYYALNHIRNVQNTTYLSTKADVWDGFASAKGFAICVDLYSVLHAVPYFIALRYSETHISQIYLYCNWTDPKYSEHTDHDIS